MLFQQIRLFVMMVVPFGLSAQTSSVQSLRAINDSLHIEVKVTRLIEDGRELTYGIVTDSILQRRKALAPVFEQQIDEWLSQPNSFSQSLDSFLVFHCLYPPDSSFRIMTWSVRFGNDDMQSFGRLQLKNGKVFSLRPTEAEAADLPNEELKKGEWLPSLYLSLMPQLLKKQPYYLLFGISKIDRYTNRKVLEVLSFDQEQNPIFGKQIFDFNQDSFPNYFPKRIILEYDNQSVMNLRYDDNEKMILYDNLIPMMNPVSHRMAFYSDGSYMGLKPKRGRWKHIIKIKTLILKEAPRETPILDYRKGKDIIGN